jgi:hypothetical protein
MDRYEARIQSPAPSWRPTGALTPAAARAERSDRVRALIVIGLTLACTVIALFDLLLLASSS